ncbi:MAG TPA: ABC transporter permease [Bacteroidales bacterium]|nr:ABC transporter permease [Bacteroidales bacterium]
MNSVVKIKQLWQLILSQSREIIREPGVLFWGIVFPILMSLGLGLAFTKKGEIIRKVAVITDTQVINNPVISSFLNERCEKNETTGNKNWRFRYKINDDKLGNSVFLFYEMKWEDAVRLLKRGTMNVLISATSDSVEYHFDPMNSDAELTYMKLSSIISYGVAQESIPGAVIRPLTTTGTRYIDFLVPGLITMGVMMSCMWGISYGIIEKRSKKLLRRLVATPMRKSHFLIALITVRIIMNIIESLALLIFAIIVFKMRIQGDITSLILVYIAGNIAFAGLAVFVSSHTSSTEVGNGLINFVVMPMMVLSGIFFSYQNFPDWSHGFIKALPLTMMTDNFRSIINEGSGIADAALPVVILTGIGFALFASGLKIFKWH